MPARAWTLPARARTELEKMLAIELHNGWDAQLTAARSRARRPPRACNDTRMDDEDLRKHVYMNFQCVILDGNRVTLGDDVSFGPNVHSYAATHPLDADERIKGPELSRPVTIGAKTWVGGGTLILPGVTVGEGVTLGAGGVVTKDVPPHVLAAGHPARVIRALR
ncbi:sugar O-acetyltransferase [Myxococcus faecalis]|uniref:sugar O-acetyltransferase n=1 Tax=Myxococcus faecalis TaxID=3115646 RepID=UPI003CF25B1D